MAIGNGPTEYNLLHDRWLIAVGAVVRAHQLALVSPQLREGLGLGARRASRTDRAHRRAAALKCSGRGAAGRPFSKRLASTGQLVLRLGDDRCWLELSAALQLVRVCQASQRQCADR